MSLILNSGYYAGDPGIFGSIGKALGSIGGKVLRTVGGAVKGFSRGGIMGGISGAARGAFGGGGGGMKPMKAGKMAYSQQGAPWAGRSGPGGAGQMGGMQLMGGLSGGGGGGYGGAYPVAGMAPSPGTGLVPGGSCGVSGYHLNKSGYWSNQSGMLPGASWVEPGSKCVKNRHMNPLNPRALSRSMRRLSGFTRAARSAEKMIARLARQSGGARRSCAPRGRFGKKCGCK